MEQQVQLQTRPNWDLNNWSQPVQQQNPWHCPLQALANLQCPKHWVAQVCGMIAHFCKFQSATWRTVFWPWLVDQALRWWRKTPRPTRRNLPIDAKPASLVKCNESWAWVGLDMASWIWNVMFCRDFRTVHVAHTWVIRLCCCVVLLFLSDIPYNLQLLICQSGLLQRLAEAVDLP